jgi:hypothetical protein
VLWGVILLLLLRGVGDVLGSDAPVSVAREVRAQPTWLHAARRAVFASPPAGAQATTLAAAALAAVARSSGPPQGQAQALPSSRLPTPSSATVRTAPDEP